MEDRNTLAVGALTLRDKFACAALTGLLAGDSHKTGDGRTPVDDDVLTREPTLYASLAYELADAMLRARGNHN